MTDSFRLRGERALVTGVGRRIGFTSALALTAAGADVDVSAQRVVAREDARAPRSPGPKADAGRASPIALDGSDVASIRASVAAAAEALGGLDVLVNRRRRGSRMPT